MAFTLELHRALDERQLGSHKFHTGGRGGALKRTAHFYIYVHFLYFKKKLKILSNVNTRLRVLTRCIRGTQEDKEEGFASALLQLDCIPPAGFKNWKENRFANFNYDQWIAPDGKCTTSYSEEKPRQRRRREAEQLVEHACRSGPSRTTTILGRF